MIHPDVVYEHTEINQVRNFVDISKIAQPNPRTLYVLHENGRILKAWDSASGKVSVPGPLNPSFEKAEELRLQFKADEVQLIDRETYQRYLKEALNLEKARDLTGYDFKEWTKNLKLTMGNGFLIHPAREHYDYFHYVERTKAFIREKLQPDCVFLIGVNEGRDWWTSGVFVFTGGLVTTVSTFETFEGKEGMDAALPATHQNLMTTAAWKFQKTAFGLFLSREPFELFAKNQWRKMGQQILLKTAP